MKLGVAMCASLSEVWLNTGRAVIDQSYASERPCGSAEDRPSSATELPMLTVTAVPALATGARILSAQRAVANASARQPATRPSRVVIGGVPLRMTSRI